ncbi:MAG: DUF2752 domain-containing protein [Verrucomicrobiota bacterium]|nr:DUF2752 domain-containing protein [Verrucomicrobiota bacterium]
MTAPSPMPLPPKIRPAPSLAFFSVTLVAATTFAACALVFFFNPSKHAFYPVCLFHRLTRLNCPGCGGTRAVYALLHGRFETALRDNALFIGLLPALALRGAWIAIRKPPATPFFPPGILWGLLVVAILFAVLRNLPQFSFLSP